MIQIGRLGLGLLMGALCALGHMALLKHTIGRVEGLDPTSAGQRVSRTMPLRVLCWTPVLWAAIVMGLWACIGLAVGIFITRVIAISRMGALSAPSKRG